MSAFGLACGETVVAEVSVIQTSLIKSSLAETSPVATSLVETSRIEMGPKLQRYTASQPQMGTTFTITLYAADQESANQALAAGFARIAELNGILSDYDASSEARQLCATAPHAEPLEVSEDLWNVLSTAQQLARQTEGAFDVTVGPLTKLWRRARRQRALPPADEFQAAREAVGYRFVQLDSERKRVALLRPGMQLDFGGIAKGYALDQVLQLLAQRGIESALVNAGGDLAVSGPPPGQESWPVAIAGLSQDDPPRRYRLAPHRALATSGDLWQFVELDGQRYSHILDPHTGMGLTRRSSVSVTAPTGMLADALASTFSVGGPESAMLWRDQHYPKVEFLIIQALTENRPDPRPTGGQPPAAPTKGTDAEAAVRQWQTEGFPAHEIEPTR